MTTTSRAGEPRLTPGPAAPVVRHPVWTGPNRPYDLVKEVVVAFVVMAVATVGLALVFSSPDDPQVSLRQWAATAPADFVATATGELAGTTTSAGYGPPYNAASTGQRLGPLTLQQWAGISHPLDPGTAFVLSPLRTLTGDPALTSALAQWDGATPDQRTGWATRYADALATAPQGDPGAVASGDYGPVPTLTAAELALARRGGLDAQLVSPGSGFYLTDYTAAGLFLADGGYFDALAGQQHLHGEQWGMANETGSYPGQFWLLPISFLYQVPPFNTSDNGDVLVLAVIGLITAVIVLLPLIPGLRQLPRKLPVYRLIWRRWYAEHPDTRPGRRTG